jgi:hypothetical protein
MRSFRLEPSKSSTGRPWQSLGNGCLLILLAYCVAMVAGAMTLAEHPENGRMVHPMGCVALPGCLTSAFLFILGVRLVAKGIDGFFRR